MGVRYNAEKKKVGNYFSTPIYSFRCKCHLCDGWFEIQTDPKNTRYVVVSGARQKDEEWNPEENGGFAVIDTDGNVPADPLAALEKTTGAESHHKNVEVPRLESLMGVSDHFSADPYTLSLKVRKQFRQDKKVRLDKEKADSNIRDRYALPTTLALAEDDQKALGDAKEQWEKARHEKQSQANRQRRLPTQTSITFLKSRSTPKPASGIAGSLRMRILNNTARTSARRSGQSSQLER
ncbi:Protein saf4 [Paramarasmius palmivorus]|uniref:Protein saf4 n=1 Tax=Paramarasmius palmivorus TaxID=297713 RepID=A0AAW0DIR2_9AGAR